MIPIDVTTTATLRPEILETTLRAFTGYLFNDDSFTYRLILNIDPVGDQISPQNVIDVARGCFPGEVVANVAKYPNFSVALKWVWSQVEAEFFFNLEDDWLLMRPVSLAAMVETMKNMHRLALLRLCMFPSKTDTCRQWNRHVPWNGTFFEIPDEKRGSLGYSGHPSLIRKAFISPTLPYIRNGWCPEKTLKSYLPAMATYLQWWRFGVWQEQNAKPSIKDIGRVWRLARRWYKHRGYSFSTWEKLPDGYDERSWYDHLKEQGVQ